MKITFADLENIAQCMALEYCDDPFYKVKYGYSFVEPYGAGKLFSCEPDCGHVYKVDDDTCLVVFKGTHKDKYGNSGWGSNFDCDPVPMVDITKKVQTDVKVHDGFQKGWKAVREQVYTLIKPFRNVWITGHSRGSALCTLAAENIKFDCPEKKVGNFPFSSPRVGNNAFVRDYCNRVEYSLHIYFANDPVHDVPLELQGYSHVPQIIQLKPKWYQLQFVLAKNPFAHYPAHLLRELKQLREVMP